MTEEPKQADRRAQENEQDNRGGQGKGLRRVNVKDIKEFLALAIKGLRRLNVKDIKEFLALAIKSFLGRVIQFFRVVVKNATLVITVLYIYVTGIGLLYSRALYRKFGIDIFDYSEIGDFFLAAFKYPSALLITAEAAALGLIILVWGEIMDKMGNRMDPTPEAGFMWTWGAIINAGLVIVFIVVVPVLLSYDFSDDAASSIKDSKPPSVIVHYRTYSGSAGQVTKYV